MIIQTIDQNQFIDAFKAFRPNNFTIDALVALYDYFDEYSDDTQVDYNLDVIALCCEYTEYKDIEAIKENYASIKSIEDLENHTTVIIFDGGIILQNF